MSNPTIGMVTCPLCGEPAAVRKDKSGRFYYISAAGRISPSSDFGQQWFMDEAVIWGQGAPAEDAPDWIAEGKSWPSNSMSKHRSTRKDSSLEDSVEAAPAATETPPPVQPEPEPEPAPAPADDGGFLDGFFGED